MFFDKKKILEFEIVDLELKRSVNELQDIILLIIPWFFSYSGAEWRN